MLTRICRAVTSLLDSGQSHRALGARRPVQGRS
jgi:hypothetical protein